MRTLQTGFCQTDLELPFTREGNVDLAARDPGICGRVRTAEKKSVGRNFPGMFEADRVVAVHYGEIPRSLAPEQGELGSRVGLETIVAVQVVLRYVQQYAGIRPEGGSGIELEAADLKDEHVGVCTGKYPLAKRRSEIAANEGMPSGLLQHFTDESGCCRLPVGPRYGDHRKADPPPRPLQLPDYLYSPLPRLFERFDVQWNAGAHDYPVRFQEVFKPVGSQAERAARLLDAVQGAIECLAGAQIRPGYLGPPASQ